MHLYCLLLCFTSASFILVPVSQCHSFLSHYTIMLVYTNNNKATDLPTTDVLLLKYTGHVMGHI